MMKPSTTAARIRRRSRRLLASAVHKQRKGALCTFAMQWVNPSLLILLATVTGCERRDELITGPQPAKANRTEVVPMQPARGSRLGALGEDFMVALTKEEPGLVGYFIDEQHRIVAYVTDSARFASARNVLERHRASDGLFLSARHRGAPIVLRKADYSFQQLSDWRDDVTEKMFGVVRGVVGVDLDESRNRLTVEINKSVPSAEGQARQFLSVLGVPAAAVVFAQTEPPRRLAAYGVGSPPITSFPSLDLRTIHDTVAGGIQVQQNNGNPSTYPTGTLGLVVDSGSTRGFLTVSHVSSSFFAKDTSHLHQTTVAGQNIGVESMDPAPVGGVRESDASFYHLNVANVRRGVVYRTTSRHTDTTQSINIYSGNPFIHMFGSSSSISMGEDVDKVGRTTGWTHGTVDATCSNIFQENIGGTNHTIYCTYRANGAALGGDSGGPVFGWDGADGGLFLGIVWGGLANKTYFALLSGIQFDMGVTFTVTSQASLGFNSASGSLSGSPSLSWSATSSGTSNTTTYKVYRSTWRADLGSYTENGTLITTTTATSFTDNTSQYITLNSYYGTTDPGSCDYSWVSYRINAYNSGISTDRWVWFLGAYNPDGCVGQE